AGDGRYLAVAGLAVLAVYSPLVLLAAWTGASFTWLWVTYGAFMAARLVTLWLRQRGDAWIVLGATRSAD
ncbi:MAG: family efflux transporter, partial [Frankiales bacterium]|nr:family efflux transporter [Frankiales bacterium]